MYEKQHYGVEDYRALYKSLNRRWRELCERYLPVMTEGSIWKYSRRASADDPQQGWKLHIPATVLTASLVLERVAPLLHSHRTLFKAPVSLQELERINCGLYYGYSQVGKFITIYPRTTAEAVMLARSLHRITCGMTAPSVPYDLKFRPTSRLYYRYGSFTLLEKECADGTRSLAMRDPGGNLVADRRDSEEAMPGWVSDPFPKKPERHPAETVETPLRTTFRAFRALSQRGKGGVYLAVNLGATPACLCILKEGRKDGETSFDGRDGYWRIKHEEHVLASLGSKGIKVPRLYSSFEAEKNYYLVIEHIEGESMGKWLGRKKRRLSVARALRYSVELAVMMSGLHAAGWVWRDCKLANIIRTKDNKLRPIDFEGACPVNQPDPMPWGTPSFVPPEWRDEFQGQSRVPEDLYALGVIIYFLLTGCLPDSVPLLPIEKLRRNVPAGVREAVMELLQTDPTRRPTAHKVASRLQEALDLIVSPSSDSNSRLNTINLHRLRRRAATFNSPRKSLSL